MHLFRLAIFSMIVAPFFSAGVAFSKPQAGTGLGTSWPNATDVSTSPHYHVYRFERAGIRYVQVNDGNGTVRGAVGYTGGQILDLPIGADASPWVIGTAPGATSGEPVYRDEAVSISAALQSDGTEQLIVTPSTCEKDPLACSGHGP